MGRAFFNKFKITVGVCVKNGAAVIDKAIHSIMDQSFPHELMEVIFVDDGSDDNTLSVIQSYIPKLDMRVKLFHHKWKGLGASRNVVVDNAAGKYIIWVDADMTLSKDFVAKQLAFMEKNPRAGIGKGQYGLCAQDSLVGDLENIEFVAGHIKRREKADSVPLGTGGSIYRVEAIRQIGGFDPKNTGSGEDVDAERRIQLGGWLLMATSAIFYERRRGTWRSLWNEYYWFGKGSANLVKKNRQVIEPYRLWPPVVLAIELSRVVLAYKLTCRKIVFLLPIHYIFKRVAWFIGFARTILIAKNGNKNQVKVRETYL